MTDQRQHMKRTQITPSYGINSLIEASNRDDRFELLEDGAVLPANLTNPVHPMFYQLKDEKQLHVALQLASHFLLHDRLLEFFVPLFFGDELYDVPSKKTFLCDPLASASISKRASLLAAVHEALQSLAERVEICFSNHKKGRLYARTLGITSAQKPGNGCCRAFQDRMSPKIELTDKFLRYYNDADGYAVASRCAQFRHDFLFATTLVHEIVHAAGVMRRGNLVEPHYRRDFPETELGYAWENFMFGSVLNPQDKTKFGTHLLMRKVWADAKVADANGGKEYCDVSMAWIAQWFRSETWNIISRQGPTAIAPPTTHFKIQISNQLVAWVVISDCPEVRKDIADLWKQWQKHDKSRTNGGGASQKIYYSSRTTAELQKSNVPAPQRTSKSSVQPTIPRRTSMIGKMKSSPSRDYLRMSSPRIAVTTPLVAVCRAAAPCDTRKRRRHARDDVISAPINNKRLCKT